VNEQLEVAEDAFDQTIKDMDDVQKMRKMRELKVESALVFYDYFMDLNQDLAHLFLKNPFIDTALIEKKDKALKYWNFFSQKKVQNNISIVGQKATLAAGSESNSDSSDDTDSDSDLDKEEILKGDKPSLLDKEYEDN
jgi:hypothetical protein